MEVLFGILIPFIGTTLGSACVFFMKRSLGDLVQRALAGFAAGVMVAASIWSLLIPAIEQSESMGRLSFLPAFISFWVGVLFLLLLDRLIPHLHIGSDKVERQKKSKAFLGGVLSGVVEPVGAVLTLLAARLVIPSLPYLLSFAAGAMLYVVVEELIPEMSQGRHSNVGTIFFAVGFSVMMMLDVALG
ncbi:MAG: ZIP family metal transporter [Clostridia bacterium]|nr:ZIP family metal transporter [Clostridia bacterium]